MNVSARVNCELHFSASRLWSVGALRQPIAARVAQLRQQVPVAMRRTLTGQWQDHTIELSHVVLSLYPQLQLVLLMANTPVSF